MRVIGALSLLTVMLITGCVSASGESGGAEAAPPALGEPVTLKPGEKAVFTAERLQVRFDRVASDSRCPKDVQCMWAGEAVIRLTVTLPDNSSRSIDVKTSLTDSASTVGSFRVSVSDLQPQPTAGEAIRESDYRATLIVMKS